jgi:regulator of sigma E protease
LESLPKASPKTLHVLRGDGDDAQSFEVALSPLTFDGTGWPLVGVRFEAFDVGLAQSGARAARAVALYSGKTLAALWKLLQGDEETRAATSGPPGIVKELKEAASRGLADFLWLLAFLNISLGLLNLLPVPALDGIKVLIMIGEGVFRREVNPYVLAVVNLVGLVLLLGLIVTVSIRDITKLLG